VPPQARRGTIIVRIGADKSGFDRALKSTRKSLSSFNSFSARIAKTASIGIAGAIGAVAGVGVKTALELDKARSDIARATGAVGEELVSQFREATDAMKQVPNAASEVAASFGVLRTLASGTDEAIGDLTVDVLRFVDIAGGDAALVSKRFGQVVQTYGAGAEEAAKSLDVLVKVSTSFGVSGEKLLTILQRYGPVFKNAGFSIAETAAVMGQFEARGLDVSRIGPGINAFFRKMAAEGRDSRKELVKLVAQLNATADESEALSIATNALGAEGAQRFLAAVRSGLDVSTKGLREFTAEAEGSLDTIYGNSQTFGEKLRVLWNRISITLGEKVLPVLSRVVDFAEQQLPRFIGRLGDLRDTVRRLAADALERIEPKLRGIAEAMRPVVEWLGRFIRQNPQAVFAGLAAVLGAIALGALIAAIGALIALLAGPVGFLIAIGAVTTALVGLYRESETFRRILAKTGEVLRDIWEALQVLRPAVESVGAALRGLIDFLAGVFTGDWARAWDGLKTYVTNLAEAAGKIGMLLLQGLQRIIDEGAPLLGRVGLALIEYIWAGLKPRLNYLWADFPLQLLRWIGQLAANLDNVGVRLLELLWEGLRRTAKAYWDLLPVVLFDWLPALAGLYFRTGVRLLELMWKGIVATLKQLYDTVPRLLLDWLPALAGIYFRGGVRMVRLLWAGSVETLKLLYDTVPRLLFDWLPALARLYYRAGAQMVRLLWAGIKETLHFFFLTVPGLLLRWSGEIVQQMFNVGKRLAQLAWAGLRSAVRFNWLSLPGLLAGWTRTTYSRLRSIGAAMGRNIAAGVLSALTSLPSQIASKVSGAASAVGGGIGGAFSRVKSAFGAPFGAEGAIVTRPTFSLIGEAGPEAVVPLHRMPGARPLPGRMGSASTTINLVFNGDVYDEAGFRELVVQELYEHERLNGPLRLAGYSG